MKNILIGIYLSALCGAVATLPCMAQQQSYSASPPVGDEALLHSFEQRFAHLDSLFVDGTDAVIRYAPGTVLPMVKASTTSSYDSLYIAMAAHRMMSLRSQTGLQLTGQVYGRLDNAFHADEENDDDTSLYKAKTQLEVGWNPFATLLWQREAKLAGVASQVAMERIAQQQEHLKQSYNTCRDHLNQAYGRMEAILIQERVRNLQLMQSAYTLLLAKGKVAASRIYEVGQELMEAQGELLLKQTAACAATACADTMPPPVAAADAQAWLCPTIAVVDSVGLQEWIRQGSADAEMERQRNRQLESRVQLERYGAKVTLAPYVRVSSYWNALNSINNNIDIGLRFTLPLQAEHVHRRKALRTEQQLQQLREEERCRHTADMCHVLCVRIGQLNEAIQYHTHSLSDSRAFLADRSRAYREAAAGYDYMSRMNGYNQYIKGKERLCTLMLTRELLLVQLAQQAGLPVGSNLIKHIAL